MRAYRIRSPRFVFGNDYPMNFYDKPEELRQYIANISNLDLGGEIKEGMLGKTAACLLKL